MKEPLIETLEIGPDGKVRPEPLHPTDQEQRIREQIRAKVRKLEEERDQEVNALREENRSLRSQLADAKSDIDSLDELHEHRFSVQEQRLIRLRAEVRRLAAWLRLIEGGEHPVTDESKLRQMAYRAVVLGHAAPDERQ